MAEWPTHLTTILFVAARDRLADAHALHLSRLRATQARPLFVAAHPGPESDDAALESRSVDIPAPETLELYSLSCVIAVNPEFEEAVTDKLFLGDPDSPDPFPAHLDRVDLTRW